MFKLLLLMVGLVGCIIPSPADASNEIETAARSSVQIQIYGWDEEWTGIGSGVLIRDNDIGLAIITAQHVAEATYFQYRACSVLELEECVLLGNYQMDESMTLDSDWAIYPIDEKPSKYMRPAKVSHRVPRLGEELVQLGIPGGDTPFFNTAEVAWVYTDGYMLHGFAYPGSSGGGVFDHRGRLVGLTTKVKVLPDVFGMPDLMVDMVWVTPVKDIEGL